MHLSRVDLNLLVVFDTIVAEGSITRASERLNLSQPAVSHALARLRQLVGDPLFQRHGRDMMPTPLARRMAEPIRRSLHELAVTLAATGGFDPARATRRFVIGIRDVREGVILPSLMGRIARDAPGVDIAVVRAGRRDLGAALAAGTLDLAIDVPLPLPAEIRRLTIGDERLAVVARRGHPRIDAKLDLAAYLAEQHVAVSQRRRGQTAEDFELGRRDLGRRVRLRCQNYFAACQVVAETDLLLTMPERHAGLLNRRFGNQILAFPLDVAPYDVCLYWHARADADPANGWLRDQVLAAAGLPSRISALAAGGGPP
ncbi:LysR family transcriptional regulator [Phreatobacter sp. AB_2022a]|uniref:LysR family transcriptional regulator n=1 Tax=Phreatobacter sp. AB_2022a TaxID=3003134 RepID=UPI0022871D92|nr:LysR family transcriptional regulator [Phreatobacter sp. AB_2022a]MCZ0734558.1 LysR family transcriptional regulator [Phreatobacter sp. AB_2022a]